MTAILFTARRPDLSRGLIVADASPAGGADAAAIEFASRAAAIEHFGGPSLSADAWVDGLEQRDDGLWPRFDTTLMARTLRDAASRSYWEEWEEWEASTWTGPPSGATR